MKMVHIVHRSVWTFRRWDEWPPARREICPHGSQHMTACFWSGGRYHCTRCYPMYVSGLGQRQGNV